MRKVIMSNLMTLDGFMAGPKGEIDWFVVDKEFDAYGYAHIDFKGITPVIAKFQKNYDYAHRVVERLRADPSDESQITLHWIFDKSHEGWEVAYQDLADFIREEATV